MSITPDNIDVKEATARKIPVTVVPPLAVGVDRRHSFRAAARGCPPRGRRPPAVRAGVFPGSQSNHLLGAGVCGKTIGLVGGRGRIGQAVAARARGFSMRVLYCGPRPMAEADEQRLGGDLRAARSPARRVRLRLAASSAHAGDASYDRRARDRPDEAVGFPHQHRARRRRRRGGADRGADGTADRRRRARRVRERAACGRRR